MVSADLIDAASQHEHSKPTSLTSHSHPHTSSRCQNQQQRRTDHFPRKGHTQPFPLPRFFTTASTASSSPTSTFPPSQSNPSTSTPSDLNDESTDFLPPHTLTNRFKNFYRMATNTMSPAGQATYWTDADARYSAIDCARCTTHRDYLLSYSPIIRYMTSSISRLGGTLNKSNIRCRTCTTSQLGGFDAKYGIILCANYIDKRSMLEDVLAHEMVHAYDTLRFKTHLGHDEDLRKVACSEIRASNLSGECRWANEFFRNKVLSFSRHHQDCVRRRAIASVKMRPNCADDVQAVKVVNEVWDSCFEDTRPFDEIYR